MASGMISALFRQKQRVSSLVPSFPFTIETNPYRCKRAWPPDFSKLSQKHQFRLERRYRRRSKLKWARPTWTKAVKLTQWGSIIFVCIYGVLWMEMTETGKTPFDGIREWYREQQALPSGTRGRTPVKDNPSNTQPPP